MTKLTILESSLIKKQQKLDAIFDKHFETWKETNGQPMNDKRNGRAFFSQIEKQNNSIRNLQAEIEKTKKAIEKEIEKINNVNDFDIPKPIQKLIDDGVLTQWRKFPNRFFVKGVEKARIIFDNNKILYAYVEEIPNQEQYTIFKNIFNNLKEQLNNTQKLEISKE
jgi:hypothetical protein